MKRALKENETRGLLCHICENRCIIAQGGVGRCGRYENKAGKVSEIYPDKYIISCPIRIETMPMLHFHPGGRFLQVSTVGCNFDCPGCISAVIVQEMNPQSMALQHLSAEQVVGKALQYGCKGIAFLMNDPLAGFDTFLSVAILAKTKGLLVGCSSNGYFTEESIERLCPVLDFINLGVKGLSDASYHACSGIRGAAPVLRNLRLLHQAGVHLEVACIHKRDNAQELLELCSLVKDISPRIPLQVMRFIPLEGASPGMEPLISETESLCGKMRSVLDHVYVFNSPGTKYLDTVCPECGKTIIHRDFYGPMGAQVLRFAGQETEAVRCPACLHYPDISGSASVSDFREKDFQGGYPFTRALEIVESILIAIGADTKAEIVSAWEYLLCNEKMQDLHHDIQRIDKYLSLIRSLGTFVHREKRADELVDYLEHRTRLVTSACAEAKHRPRVYYAMGKPLFCIKGERFENHLVEVCNGISVNREIEIQGRPGMSISLETLEQLNPEVVFISSFISNDPLDFYAECMEKNIRVDAVHAKRIHTSPIPSSDFGGPKWILGLMFIANILHPELCAFDIQAEAEAFYQRFYNESFNPTDVNRSFGKPQATWTWELNSGEESLLA